MTRTRLYKGYLSVVLAALMLLAMLAPLVPAVEAEASTSVGSYHVWDFEDVTKAEFTSSYAGRLTEDEGPNGAQFVWFESNTSTKEYGTMEIATLADGNKVFKVTANEYVDTKAAIPNVNIYASGGSTEKLPFNADKVSISYKLKVARLVGNEEVGFGDAESGGFPRRSDIYFGSAKTGTDETTAFGIDNGKVYAGGSKYYADNGVGGPVCTTCGSKTNPLMGVADDDGFLNVKTEVDIANRTWKAYYYDGDKDKWVSAQHLGHEVVYAFSGTNISQFLFQFGYDSTYNKTDFASEKLVYYLDDIVVTVNEPTASFEVNDVASVNDAITLKVDADIDTEELKNAVVLKDSAGNNVRIGSVTKTQDGYSIKPAAKLEPNTQYTVSIPENTLKFAGAWSDVYVNVSSANFTTRPSLEPQFGIEPGTKGVYVNTKAIDVTFVSKIETSTLQNADIVVKDSNGNEVSTKATPSSDGYKATLKLNEKLKGYTKYTIEVLENSIELATDGAYSGTYVDAASSYFYTGNPDDILMGTDFTSYGTTEASTLASLQEDFAQGTYVNKELVQGATAGEGNYTVKATADGRLEMYGNYAGSDDRIMKTYLYFTDSRNPIKGAIKLDFDVEFNGYFGRYYSENNNAQAPVMEIQDAKGTKIYRIYQNSSNTLTFVGSGTAVGIRKTDNSGSVIFSADKNYHFEITTSFDGKTATCNVYENGTLVGSATDTATNADSGFGRVMMAVWPRYCGYYNVNELTRRDQHRIYDNISFTAYGKTEAYLVNGTTDVEGDDLVIGFATPVNEADIYGKITLDKKAVTGTLSEDGYFYTLNPVELKFETEYTIAIATTKDYFGNTVAAKEIKFTTKPNPARVDVSDYSIKDAEGPANELKANQELTISATFTNSGGTPANATLFIALYDADGNMLRVAGDANNGLAVDAADDATLTATFKTPSDLSSGAYIKAFAWTDINDLTSYVEEIIFPVQ